MTYKVKREKKKFKQYELVTTKTGFDMPYPVFSKNKKTALKEIKRKLRKGERIISLKKVKW